MDKIKMLVGQEGPALSRLPGQVLVVGNDIDADEAQRLVDGDLAIEVRAEPAPAAPAAPTPAAPIVAPAAATAAKPAQAKRKAKTPAVAA